jgi:oxaloacetate decarboxylase alpha subunit
MSDVRFIDTTVRDGNQSLWALNMRTDAMLAVAEHIDEAGFESAEFFVTVMFKKLVREQKEDAWDWFRLGTKRFRKTPLRLHGGLKIIEKIPVCVFELMIKRIMDYGITLTRTSNSWNNYDEFDVEKTELKKLGMDTVVNLIYSVSPRHTDEYYARKAREAAALKPHSVCFKDVGGLLTPERTRALVPLVMENIGDTPVEFHAHCNNGLAPLCFKDVGGPVEFHASTTSKPSSWA